MPSKLVAPSTIVGVEKNDEKSRQRRSQTRSRQRPSGWQGAPDRSWTPYQPAPNVCTDIQATYESELTALSDAYPKTLVWHQKEGLWLLTESNLLTGAWQRATFITAIPFAQTLSARSWGFWTDSMRWIGPRHTNFPDGSICAFEPADKTWSIGDPIVGLLDLYTLWALRHLYLQVFGRWPGYQVVHHPYERFLELRKDEFCGCDKSDRLYGNCCLNTDMDRNHMADAVHFYMHTSGGLRQPPDTVVRFMRNRDEPPDINKLLS